MALSTFKKTTLIVGAVSLLILLIIAALNIYWFSDEADILLDNCVSSHFKVVVNAIMLVIVTVVALLFGIDFYKNRKNVAPEKTEEAETTPVVTRADVEKTLQNALYRDIFNYIQRYIEYTYKCYQTMSLYYSSMQSYLMTKTGLTDVSDNEYLQDLKDKISELGERLTISQENSAEAIKLYKAIENGENILNRSRIESGTPLYGQIMTRMKEDREELRRLCLEEWETSREAEKLFNSSKETVINLSKDIDRYVADKAWQLYNNKLQ